MKIIKAIQKPHLMALYFDSGEKVFIPNDVFNNDFNEYKNLFENSDVVLETFDVEIEEKKELINALIIKAEKRLLKNLTTKKKMKSANESALLEYVDALRDLNPLDPMPEMPDILK